MSARPFPSHRPSRLVASSLARRSLSPAITMVCEMAVGDMERGVKRKAVRGGGVLVGPNDSTHSDATALDRSSRGMGVLNEDRDQNEGVAAARTSYAGRQARSSSCITPSRRAYCFQVEQGMALAVTATEIGRQTAASHSFGGGRSVISRRYELDAVLIRTSIRAGQPSRREGILSC